MSIRASLRAAFGRACSISKVFARSKRANVSMIFGLSLIPITLGAGLGLDMARAMIVRSRLAEALDAAGLAVGGTSGLSQSQMQTMAQQYFNANYTTDQAHFGTPTAVSVSKTGQTITLTADVPMPTTLMRIAGMNTLTVHATSQITYGQTKLWVSLVLDNTGSMCQSDSSPNVTGPCVPAPSGSKIQALITSTTSLLTLLQGAAANPGDVKVAIVPFVKDVDVGTGNAGATWIDWTDWNAANGSCTVSGKTSQSSCTSAGTCTVSGKTSQSSCTSSGKCSISTDTSQSSCTSDGTCSISGKTSKSTCQSAGTCSISGKTTQSTCQAAGSCSVSGKTTQSACTSAHGTWTTGVWTTGVWTTGVWTTGVWTAGIWTAANHNTWNGCVMDRGSDSGPDTSNNYDVMNTAPGAGATSKFPAEQYSTCPQALINLTSTWSDLNTEVANMKANGTTNQTIGLVWGWQALTNTDPLNSGALPAETSRIIIILSDGLNTQNRWNGDGSNDSPQVDARMAAVCTNAKADNIIIYAVFVDIGGAQGNSSVLQNCATDASKYYDLTSASQIQAAFASIGQQITNLRVSQ
jgi:hypothetical protein